MLSLNLPLDFAVYFKENCGRASPIIFGPRTLGRTLGHPSSSLGVDLIRGSSTAAFFAARFDDSPVRHSRVGSSSGSGVSCAGLCSSGTWRRLTRMRVHVDDVPRMESTSTSSTARRRGHLRVFALPSLQPSQRILFAGRIRDHDQRHLRPRRSLLRGRLGSRRRYSRRLAFHLAKVRRPWRIAQSRRLIFGRELQQRFERTRRGIHARVWVADLREAARHA